MCGMDFELLLEVCKECEKLYCIFIYTDGSADYFCFNLECKYWLILKEAIKSNKENN